MRGPRRTGKPTVSKQYMSPRQAASISTVVPVAPLKSHRNRASLAIFKELARKTASRHGHGGQSSSSTATVGYFLVAPVIERQHPVLLRFSINQERCPVATHRAPGWRGAAMAA